MIQERAKLRVCQETIYRYIYSKDGMRDDLWWYLPTHRVARRPRRTRRRRETKFHRDVSICSARMMWPTAVSLATGKAI